RVPAPGAGQPDRLHGPDARAAQDPAGGHHPLGLRPVRRALHARAAQAGLSLGRRLPARRGVLHLPLTMRMRFAGLLLLWAGGRAAQARPERARDIGIALDGTPGPLDAITDVAGVEVGHTTIVRGEGKLKEGSGPVRTGVTAIFPRGRGNLAPV